MHLQGQQYVCAGELVVLQTMMNVLNQHTAEFQDIQVEELSRTMRIDIDATQQWCEGMQQGDQDEEDAVCSNLSYQISTESIASTISILSTVYLQS
jgi:uncharacterized protein YsxB (DUF464 family)